MLIKSAGRSNGPIRQNHIFDLTNCKNQILRFPIYEDEIRNSEKEFSRTDFINTIGTTLPSPFGAHDGGETPDSGQELCYGRGPNHTFA